MIINSASDLLDQDESAIVVFTRGAHLTINPDNSGSSGNWVINSNHIPNKVIIYCRLPETMQRQAEVYVGNYVDAVAAEERGRWVVRFKDAAQVGTTNRNWTQFAETGTNPVRYMTKV